MPRTSTTNLGRLSLILLIGLLLVSVSANVLFALRLGAAFGDLHFARNFPLGFFAEPEKKQALPKSSAVAVYGDSRAYEWGKYLKRNVQQPVANLAHGSITSSQLRLQLLSEPAVHSKIAIVQIGINDLHPLGALEREKPAILSRLDINLSEIVHLLLERSDLVVLTPIFPTGDVPLQRTFFWDDQTPSLVVAANQEIEKLSAADRVLLFDTGELLGIDATPGSQIHNDFEDPDFFLHVNETGYRTLTAALADQLRVVDQPFTLLTSP